MKCDLSSRIENEECIIEKEVCSKKEEEKGKVIEA